MQGRLSILVAAALVASGCARSLDVPTQQAPHIGEVEPASGFAGTRVTIAGSGFGGPAGQVQVRFGASGAVRPESIDAGGTALTVQVPDDATTGPVWVATAAGEAKSGADFAWRGLGHLRYRRAGVRADQLPVFDSVLAADADGQMLLWNRALGRLAWLNAVGDSSPVPSANVVAVAATPDLLRVGVLTADPVPCTGDGCRLYDVALRVYDRPGLAALRAGTDNPLATAAFRSSAYTFYMLLALDGDGSHAMVISFEGGATYDGWAISLADGAVRPFSGSQLDDSSFGWSGLAWLGGSRWVTADGFSVHLLDAAAGDPLAGVARVLSPDADLPDELVSICADGKGQVAVGGTLGILVLLDADASGLRERGRTRAQGSTASSQIDALAFSEDGSRLAAALAGAGLAEVFDVAGPRPMPLSAVAVGKPGAVAVDGAGSFLVAAPGEVVALSQTSGAALTRRRIDAHLTLAGLRLVSCPGASSSTPVEVLEIVDGLLRQVVRLDPLSLRAAPCPAIALPPEGVRLTAAATAREAGVLVLGAADARVFRYGPADLAPAEGVWRAPDAERSGQFGIISLGATGDGHRILAAVTLADGAADGAHEALYFLDSSSRWSDGQQAPRLPLPSGVSSDWLFLGDRLALLNLHTAELRLYDTTGADSGAWPLVGADPLATGVGSIEGAAGTLFLLGRDAPRLLRLFDAADGKKLSSRVIADSRGLAPAPPGGRRIDWWLDTSATPLLVSQPFDPETGALGPEEPAIDVPIGKRPGVWFPDGEHRVLIDPMGGALLLLE